VRQVKWKLVSVHLETVLIWHKIGVQIGTNIPLAQKSFWAQTMELLSDAGKMEAHFGPFGDCANLDTR
jgi:hypothetical protein